MSAGAPSLGLPFYLAPGLAHEMWQFRKQKLFEGQAAGVRGARQGNDDPSCVDPHLRPREHRRGPDFLEGEHAEQLAEPGQALVEQAVDRLERGITGRDAGAARRDHRLHRGVRARRADGTGHVGRLVADDRRGDDLVAAREQELLDQAAARVGLGGLRVGDREHETPDRARRVCLVLPGRAVGRGHVEAPPRLALPRPISPLASPEAPPRLALPYAWSRSSTMWSTRVVAPWAARPALICRMQPGLAVTTASAPVATTWPILRRSK